MKWHKRAKQHFWRPLKKAVLDPKRVHEMLQACKTQKELEQVAVVLQEEVFVNHLYQVNKRLLHPDPPSEIIPSIVHLSIKRRDKDVIKDWRHFQFIKNELCGEETMALEIYPPESKLVDSVNQYHLYVFPNDSLFPFIFQERLVTESSPVNGKQREFEIKPHDLLDADEMLKRAEEANMLPQLQSDEIRKV